MSILKFNFNEKNHKYSLPLVSMLLVASFGVSLCLIFIPIFAGASSSVGTIDDVYKYALGVEHSDIRVNFGFFKGSSGVFVTDTSLSGNAWGQNIGWFNLSPEGGGVLNNKEGILSGYASSELGGWVNFNGVTINSSGEFYGYANTEKLGRIVFNCSTNSSCSTEDFKVKTDWRPVSVRNSTTPNPTYTTPPNTPLPIFVNNTTTITTTTATSSPAPLPVGNASQYSGGGDVVSNNTSNGTGGTVTVVRPPDEPVTNTNLVVQPEKTTPPIITGTNSPKPKSVSNTIKTTTEKAVSLTETPSGSVAVKVVTVAGIAGGGTSIITALINGTFAFSEFSLLFIRVWSLILAALGLRKNREPWGTVYDSVTKQPLDPAYVILQDKNGEEVATSITDLDGRFGFLAPPGIYRLIAQKTNYIAPSLHLYGKDKDEVYDNLYFGDEIEIESSKTITRNIPMDPQGFDWNEFAKRDQKIIKLYSPRVKNIISKITNLLFFIGLLLAVLLYIVKPDSYNIAILVLYMVLFILRFVKFKTRSYGIIIDKSTGLPLPFAIIRVFQKDTNREMFHRIADLYGHYYCLLAKGEYYITIEKKEEDGSYSKIYSSVPFVAKEGIVNTNFVV